MKCPRPSLWVPVGGPTSYVPRKSYCAQSGFVRFAPRVIHAVWGQQTSHKPCHGDDHTSFSFGSHLVSAMHCILASRKGKFMPTCKPQDRSTNCSRGSLGRTWCHPALHNGNVQHTTCKPCIRDQLHIWFLFDCIRCSRCSATACPPSGPTTFQTSDGSTHLLKIGILTHLTYRSMPTSDDIILS
jgi:hypothetical protein